MAVSPVNWTPLLLLALFGWRVYARARKHIGRQRVQPKRMAFRVGIFCVVALVTGTVAWRRADAEAALGLAAGLLAGAALGWVGLRLTRFEMTPEGRFYTPNTWIGIGVLILFVGRLGYRMFLMSASAGSHPAGGVPSAMLVQSALTLFLFGVVAGYYIAYYAGVFWRSRTLAVAPAGPNGV